jgi:beta-N-acetylhexosaminidase
MRFVKRSPGVLLLSCLLLSLLVGCVTTPAKREPIKADWVEQTLARLTLREKISQMIMSRAYGYYYSDRSDEFRRLERLVKEEKVGGLIFFQGDVLETASMINKCQEMSDVPLLIGSDFEWGTAMRIRRGTRFPEAMAIGATRDTFLAYKIGQAIGEESRALGIHQIFAPVADVNSNPDNPVINTRSFGEDPYLVTDLASAFSRGAQASGVIATGKHFPGHGDTQVDSHLDLPVIQRTREQLEAVDLLPFRRLIKDGISSIMVAHLEVPALEKNETLPATLSSKIVGQFLQNDLGFQGLIVTDALDMGAIVNTYGVDSATVLAVKAGIDILLVLPDETRAIDAIVRAVGTGGISISRIETSVKKILSYKWDMGLVVNRTVDVNKVQSLVATPEHYALAKDVARKSITVVKNDSILPLESFGGKRILEVVVCDAQNYRTEIQRSSSPWPNEVVGDYFNVQLRKRTSNVELVKIDPSIDTIGITSLTVKAANSHIIICPIFSRARSGSGSFGLPETLVGIIDSLTKLGTPTILLAMGSPYVLGAFPGATAAVCAYSDCESSTEAAIEVLFGEIPARGKLPVTIPNLYSSGTGLEIMQAQLRRDLPENVGMSRDSLVRIDSIMTNAIRDGAFPGGQVCVSKDGAIVYNKSFGKQEYSTASPKISGATIYDLASVTKVIATTTAVMRLYDENKISLDERVIAYIPEFANHDKEKITVRNLLSHNGGLPAFKRLYLTCSSPQEVLDSVYQTETIYNIGDSTVYSDFDFIMLGKIIEKVSGVTLDKYTDSVFFKPLGMKSTLFNPPSSIWNTIAPTEYDSIYRKKMVRGVVHDENAYALGGVSGHAGLFSNASDLALFLQMILNGGQYGGRQYLKPETIKMFTTRQSAHSTRALGWDTKTMDGYSSAGKFFGAESFGHTGFTGTSVWVEPEKKIFVILLTNRVYPTRTNTKIMQIRPFVHDAVMRSVIGR